MKTSDSSLKFWTKCSFPFSIILHRPCAYIIFTKRNWTSINNYLTYKPGCATRSHGASAFAGGSWSLDRFTLAGLSLFRLLGRLLLLHLSAQGTVERRSFLAFLPSIVALPLHHGIGLASSEHGWWHNLPLLVGVKDIGSCRIYPRQARYCERRGDGYDFEIWRSPC